MNTQAGRLTDFWNDLRGAPVAAMPVDYQPQLPDADADELVEAEDDAPPAWAAGSISGRTFVITYADSKGQPSVRQVVCHRLDEKAGVHYLSARCLLRGKHRAFRVDRIAAVVDPVTGEVYEPGSVLLHHFMADAASTSAWRYGLPPRRFADFNAALNVLSFIARCDGHWHPLELDAIDSFATTFWIRAEVPGDLDLDEVNRHALRLSPDAETFFASLKRCAESPLLRSIIRRHIAATISADGVLHPMEEAWGRQVDEYFALLDAA